jgi:hypothetical protein
MPDMQMKERAAARLDALLTTKPKQEGVEEHSGQNSGQNQENVVSRVGIEPTTRRLRVCCSAN